ncbi:hypothetical protein FA95DRAFT_1552076 [Auriscalpium vulgare]|uniref:Uncharacterized protein n=1 Tax=Auriscalpium vulgare TaxID=40419 RepID=A0ACB8SAI6_9AGAM|nr:hypothetical protein FA95DRAFT_1552076 [Auriscalpium vulgare]
MSSASSTTTTPNDSPASAHILPLHNPNAAAHVVVPQAPLGNATNGPRNAAPGMGAKALLAKRLAKSQNPTFISPTDNLMTPVTQKISAAKKKHFTKGAPKPMESLFPQKETEESDESDVPEAMAADSIPSDEQMSVDDNPF